MVGPLTCQMEKKKNIRIKKSGSPTNVRKEKIKGKGNTLTTEKTSSKWEYGRKCYGQVE